MGYFARHWRGELSLPVSFWVNNFLLMFPLGIGLGLLMVWISAWGQSLQTASIGLLCGLGVLAVVSIWAPVGVWRSATHHVDDGGSALWAGLAKVLAGLGLVGSLINLVFDVAPELPTHLRMAAGHDPIGRMDIKVAQDKRTIVLSGPFSMGAATRFEAALKQAPQLRRVVLDSPGGRLYEAHEIAEQVRARGLQTRASADCASACTLVFIAGQQRSVAPRARLGFHRASVPTFNPLHDHLANARLQELYEDAGLPRPFVRQVLQVPASAIWFPPFAELMSAGILPPPTMQPDLDPALLTPQAPAERYREALADNTLWAELERRQPGMLDAAARRMQAARAGGQDLPAVATQAQLQALTAVPTLLKSAGPRSLESYLALLAAELRAKKGAGDAACLAALRFDGTTGGDAATPERLMPWLQQMLLEASETTVNKPLNAMEVEVLRRELGPDAPERIIVLSGGEAARKWLRNCANTIDLLDAMARLRGPQRRLAVRLMLQGAG